MRILQILPGRIWGGAEQVALDLGKHLAAMGHEVSFVARDSRAVRLRMERERLDVTFLGMRGIMVVFSARRLAALMRGIAVVHVHSTPLIPLVVMASRMLAERPRIIATRHDARSHSVFPLMRRFYRDVDSIIFVSALGRRLWMVKNLWFPACRCHAILNAIPERGACESVSLREKYGIPAATPLLLFTGRVRRTKGCAIIVEALARIKEKDWAMVFVGAPKPAGYVEKLRRMACGLGIDDRVHFYGFTSQVRSLLGEADLLLAPSTFVENCPLSPMEAMQAAKCVIATNNGGQPEFITHDVTGLLINPGRVEELASAIGRMLDDPQRREEIGGRAKAFFDSNLNYGLYAKKIIKVYEA